MKFFFLAVYLNILFCSEHFSLSFQSILTKNSFKGSPNHVLSLPNHLRPVYSVCYSVPKYFLCFFFNVSGFLDFKQRWWPDTMLRVKFTFSHLLLKKIVVHFSANKYILVFNLDCTLILYKHTTIKVDIWFKRYSNKMRIPR